MSAVKLSDRTRAVARFELDGARPADCGRDERPVVEVSLRHERGEWALRAGVRYVEPVRGSEDLEYSRPAGDVRSKSLGRGRFSPALLILMAADSDAREAARLLAEDLAREFGLAVRS